MKKYLPGIIRIIIAFLFIISAIAKMYPSPYFAITTFEVKQLYVLGFSESFAPYFSRTLIGVELALGLLILQPHFLRRIVVPATILMLLVFTTHLTIDTIQNGGTSGNCGCFGSLLPMTPIEAIIKNVVAIVLLIFLSRLLKNTKDRGNFWILTTVTFAAVLTVFMLAPIRPQSTATGTMPQESIETEIAVATGDAPAPVQSAYSQYFPNIDKGKKIMALFAPGCEHCQDTAKKLTELKSKDPNFPEIRIIFMDEEADLIPQFFEIAGAEYPYQVVDVLGFWKILGDTKDTPGVVYLWNGNIIKDWDGINEKHFVPEELVELLNKPYSEISK